MFNKIMILFLLLPVRCHLVSAFAASPGDVVINEIMWMGTAASSSDEWIELYNNTNQDIDLTNWTLKSEDGTPLIILTSTITAQGYYLLERTDDNTVKDIAADKIYSGALSDTGENLILYDSYTVVVDSAPCASGWFSGAKVPNYSMERINPLESGWLTVNWANNNGVIINGQDANGNALLSTPKAQNSVFYSGDRGDEGGSSDLPVEYKIRITEVVFNAAIDWIELYNSGDTAVDISSFMLTDLDGTDTRFADSAVNLMPGKYAVVYWDENGIDETDQSGDLNNNGVLDLYVADSGLSATDDQAILMSASSAGQYIDGVCWANQTGGFSSGEENDLLLLSSNEMWKLNGAVPSETDCVSSKDIMVDQSIGRLTATAIDNDDSNDWSSFILPTPGADNLELAPPANPTVDYQVRITEVAFAASIDWVELYNYGETAIDIANFMLTDLDGTDSQIADQKTMLAPGKYAVIYWDDTGLDETDDSGDLNNNGIVDLYVNDTGLSATDDELVLMSASNGGQYIDAVCWSTGVGEFTSSEDKDVELLADNGQWNIAGDTVTKSDCWSDASKISNGQAIGRLNPAAPDTDSKNDWYLFKLPTPGEDNPSLIPPGITLLFDPEPPFKDGQVKISLHIETVNSIVEAPQLSFTEGDKDPEDIMLNGEDKNWQGIFTISQDETERNVFFKYKVVDHAKNSVEQELIYLGLAYVLPAYGEQMYCFPNPWIMNSGQLLKFSNLGIEENTIKIFTLQGELVKTLAGQGDAYWDGTNENGAKVASGIYVYCLENSQIIKKGKMAIVK